MLDIFIDKIFKKKYPRWTIMLFDFLSSLLILLSYNLYQIDNFITVDYIKNNKFIYEKRDVILVNGVLHHISDENINKSFEIIKKISNQNAKILILEPTKPVSIFTLDFIQKILDLGINIKSSLEYEELLKKYINIEKITTYKFSYETGVVIFGELK